LPNGASEDLALLHIISGKKTQNISIKIFNGIIIRRKGEEMLDLGICLN
jgi:hypothetical protein